MCACNYKHAKRARNAFKLKEVKILSPKLCGFRKEHSTQHALLNMLKNRQKCLDKSGVVGTVLMNLTKAYNCLPHDLLLAKRSAYGFDESAITNYLSNRY